MLPHNIVIFAIDNRTYGDLLAIELATDRELKAARAKCMGEKPIRL